MGRLTTSLRLTISDGITVGTATDGEYSRVLAAAKTLNLDPGRYRHTVKVTETDGSITVIEEGFIDIDKDLP
jgi:hypothetical protein